MTSKSKGVSVRQRLRDFSQKNDIAYDNLETAFLIERLVARLIADKELGFVLRTKSTWLRKVNTAAFGKFIAPALEKCRKTYKNNASFISISALGILLHLLRK